MEIWWMCWEASTKSLLYLQHTLICACMRLKFWATASLLSRISAVHTKSSAEMRLNWQYEFIVTFIQCHDLLCSTWMRDEWHNRISQWSHFKSPLAQGKGLDFSAVCYTSPGLHTGWVKRCDGWNAYLDELPWLSNPRAQKNVQPPGWVWTSKNNSINTAKSSYMSLTFIFKKKNEDI